MMTTKTKALRWPAFSALSPKDKYERFFQRWGAEFLKGECNRFKEEITPELVSMVLRFWHGPPEGQEELLRQMHSQPDLFFGCRRGSRWQPGLMALWKDYFDRAYDGVDVYLIVTDFRGKDMFYALDGLHRQRLKDISQDFLERRIERLFPES